MNAIEIDAQKSESWSAESRATRRPLYIVGKERVQIRAYQDFLVVQSAGHAARHFPFAKLDRIVCHAGVDWSGEAVAQCLRQRVTISWLTARGELLGHCTSRIADNSPLHACMERFAALPIAPVRWDNWFRHRRMVVLSGWAERQEKAGDFVPATTFRELNRGYVYRRESPLRLSSELLGPVQSFIVARLNREGVQNSYPGRNDKIFDLLEQLTLLLWGHANLDAGSLAGAIQERRIQWQFLESWQKGHFATLEEHLVTFKLFLVETLGASP